MSGVSLGFKTPTQEVASVTDYDVIIDGISLTKTTNQDEVTWNDSVQVGVAVELSVDLDRLIAETGFNSTESAEFGATIHWKSTGSGLHGASKPVPVSTGTNELSLSLDGSLLGEELILRPSIILLSASDARASTLTPSRKGSRLWSSDIRVRLEGTGSQFPTSKLDFKENGIKPTNALWLLKISSDLEAHFSSAVRLYLNTGSARTRAYLESPNSKAQQEFGCFLEADLVTQLLTFALNCDFEQIEESSTQEGSLAEALLQIYRTYFPTIDFVDCQSLIKSDPSLLSATVIGNTFESFKA